MYRSHEGLSLRHTSCSYEARHDKTAPMSDILEIELESPDYSRGSYLLFLSKKMLSYGIVYYCGTGV